MSENPAGKASSTTKTPPGVLQMPAALAVARGPGDAGAKLKGGAQEDDSAVAIDQHARGASITAFSSLQNLNAAIALHDPFAHTKLGQEAESSNQAAQIG